MKKILVIGADSFIANQFINRYRLEFDIIGYSRVQIDYCNYIMSADFLDILSCHYNWADAIINFAAIVHQPDLADKELYKKVNTLLPIHIAQMAKKNGIKHYIQMSSIAVYGNLNSINLNSIENPVNIYGETKLLADKSLLSLQNKKFEVSIVRPPMVYGAGNAPGNLMKLINFVQRGLPVPFKGINNARDFIHVNNLIQVLHIIIENKYEGIVIPTDQKSVSTYEIVNLIKKYSSKPIRQFKLPKMILLLIKKIIPSLYEKVFGTLRVKCNLPSCLYRPVYGIEDGIKEMVEFLTQKT